MAITAPDEYGVCDTDFQGYWCRTLVLRQECDMDAAYCDKGATRCDNMTEN